MRYEEFVYYAIHFIYTSYGITYEYTSGTLYRTKKAAEKAISSEWERLKIEGEELKEAKIKNYYPINDPEEESREAWQSLGDAYQEAMEEING